MKTFKEWLVQREWGDRDGSLVGTYAIVNCKTRTGHGHQTWGAMSDLKCGKKKKKKRRKS